MIVFIDAANLYNDFRRAFCSKPMKPTDGQFDPQKLSALLASRAPEFEEWYLVETRVYAGRAAAAKDPKGAAAADRQMAAWRAAGTVVRDRPLSYQGWPQIPAHQKGVDVELAVDVVRLGLVDHLYDVGIVVSTDTDLVPALEAVHSYRAAHGGPRITVVGFDGVKKRLRLSDPDLPRVHLSVLSAADYVSVMDPTIYVQKAGVRAGQRRTDTSGPGIGAGRPGRGE